MEQSRDTIVGPREFIVISAVGLALAIVMTWPIITGRGHLGPFAVNLRTLSADERMTLYGVVRDRRA